MNFFKSPEELKNILGGFFVELASKPEVRSSFIKSGLVIKFDYEQPELSITIDCRGGDIKFLYNADEPKPDVLMRMKADVAHKFWMGEVNLMMAIARRQITTKGQIPKILKLLPVVKPAYKLYPEYLKRSHAGA